MNAALIVFILLAFVIALFLIERMTRPLTNVERVSLAEKRRAHDIRASFYFSVSETLMAKEERRSFKARGAMYPSDIPIEEFPSYAAGFLKGKKHEWIVIAFANQAIVKAYWINKGHDRNSVAPVLDYEDYLEWARTNDISTLIVLHNHPSGVLSPSSQDITSARHLSSQANVLDVSVLEFVCAGGYPVEYWISVPDTVLPVETYRSAVSALPLDRSWSNISVRFEYSRPSPTIKQDSSLSQSQ